ncbi:MAG: fatty acid kinase fatty acid binding subunit [Chloroflexota bacterium]|nr:fatty acid kinase fatty acid binding subunit [Chloroflexota bacterium]
MCSPSSDVIHLVTDSTSDITPSDAAALGVSIVPLEVRFGNEEYRDGVDIDADAFYAKLEHSDAHPRTSQPSPEAFATLFRTLLADPADQVVGLHISSKLSGTLQSARLGAQEFDAGRVHLVDTESVSGGLQLLVRAALDDVKAGDDAETVAAKAVQRRSLVTILVLLDTLAYLHRGGRIGRAKSFVGGLLNVKPLLAVRDGEVAPIARPRSRAKGIDMIVEDVRGRAPLRSLAAFHAAAPESMRALVERLRGADPGVTAIEGRIGPVVGAYSGPGGVGIACLASG